MSIQSAMARFQVQENFGIDASSYEWPEFANFLRLLRTLQRATTYSRPAHCVEELLVSSRILRKILTTSPVNPKEAIKELSILNSDMSDLTSNVASEVSLLLNSISELSNSTNPFAQFAEDLISTDAGKSNGNPDIVLIVHKIAQDLTRLWLIENDLSADVLSVSQTKSTETFYKLGLLFGLPEQHIYTHHHVDDIKSQAAWVITTPIANRIRVCIGPGSDSFKSIDYEPWAGCWPKEIVAMKPAASDLLHIDIEAAWTPSRPVFEKNLTDISIDTAGAILTTDNKWIVFDSLSKFKPMPLVLDVDAQFVEKKFNQLQPGDVLALHYGRSSRDFLRETAITSLTNKGKDVATILNVVEEFKAKFRELAEEVDAQSKLLAVGLDRDFVNYWLRYIDNDASIAPESEVNYIKVARLCGVSESLINHRHMREYRSAIQHAGNVARTELLNELSINLEWKDSIQHGSYLMNLTNAGSMLIAPIKDISAEKFNHPVNKLGSIYSSLGEMLDE